MALRDSLTAPQDLTDSGYWSNQWDTYVTIGKDDAESDETQLSPGFHEVTDGLGGSFESENAGWFVTPDAEQSRSQDGRVLLGQFTVAEGTDFWGVLNLLDRENNQWEQMVLNCGLSPQPAARRAVARVTANEFESDRPCPGDADGTGTVDFADMLAILTTWQYVGGPEDVDQSGTVDFGDILVVLTEWGPCE